MAILLSAGDRVDVWTIGSYNQQRIMNTFSWGVSVAPGPGADWDNFVGVFNTHLIAGGSLIPAMRQALPGGYVLQQIWYQLANTAVRFRLTKKAHSLAGLWDGTGDTGNVAGVIARRGDLANRRNQSTLHMLAPTGPEALVGGFLTAPYKSALITIRDEILETRTVVTGAGAVVLDPVIPNGPLASDVTPITTADVGDTVRIMRRRTVGLGI